MFHFFNSTNNKLSPYPLNKLSAAAAYSLRKLKSTSELAIRVRRSSDNTEANIGFSGFGLDTTTLLDFVYPNIAPTSYPTFSSLSGWVNVGCTSYIDGSGQVVITNSNGITYGFLKHTFTTVIGRSYSFNATLVAQSSTNSTVAKSDDDAGTNAVYGGSGLGVRSFTFTATSTSTQIRLFNATLNASSTWQNAYLKDLGVDGFVTTWYDQSGNSRNAVQITTGNQPRIVNAGVVDTLDGRPSVRFTGNAYMNYANVASQPTTVNVIVRLNSAITNAHITDGAQTSPRTLVGISGANWVTYAGAIAVGATYTIGASDVLTATFNGASSIIAKNGTSINVDTGTQGMTNQFIGAGGGGIATVGIDGWIQEFVVLNSLISTTNRQTLERSQGKYYGISVA